MTQEEKQLLLKDLSARLPYGVICKIENVENEYKLTSINVKDLEVSFFINEYKNHRNEYVCTLIQIKPYLRPMSSMTEEEKRKFQSFFPGCFGDQWLDIEEGIIEIFECSSTMTLYLYDFERMIDWLNAHHFDYRGLIEKGLAIEVTEENNPYKE